MHYTLIKGTFHVVGQSPDGDSIKFRAADPRQWEKLDPQNHDQFVRNFTQENGVVNLRLEGVDALETHFTPPADPAAPGIKPKGYAQPSTMGRAAANHFLDFMGVTEVKWRTFGYSAYIDEATVNGTRLKDKLTDAIPGYIVTGDVEKNGRPVSWVFRGSTSAADGIAITRDQLAKAVYSSANYSLLRSGMVYPYFFMTLPAVVRGALAEAVRDAQATAARMAAGAPTTNLWQIDDSVRGVNLSNVRVITEQRAILPYLFRKLIKHYQTLQNARTSAAGGKPITDESIRLEGFFADGNPNIFVISEQDFLRLDDVVQVDGTQIRMRTTPQDLVFLS
ncbi:MAG: hypothetical protein U0670_11795 [Anaerolineae bacterium]